jgi:hypothetical protein
MRTHSYGNLPYNIFRLFSNQGNLGSMDSNGMWSVSPPRSFTTDFSFTHLLHLSLQVGSRSEVVHPSQDIFSLWCLIPKVKWDLSCVFALTSSTWISVFLFFQF